MTDLINELMNHNAVYRTAPATLGLLIRLVQEMTDASKNLDALSETYKYVES